MSTIKRCGCPCHPSGERNGNAKLTWAKVNEIRLYYKRLKPLKKTSIVETAMHFEYPVSTVSGIICNRNWINK